MKPVRCAIYTRKSSEEGLEQSFNSLDAQYGACSAYVASQAGENWVLLKQRYDDGGISGGTLDRPALQQLLSDIADAKIDIVVVYKVDRLTRSLLDFSKLVEAFDKAGTSFVSVTQSFNTTTSMGRLTLNMLLSFAQFEREVTAERIRDKLAASKARGMWMGGRPPLGYRPDGRTLAIVEEHAALVRTIFTLYRDLGTVRQLQDELSLRGIVKPERSTKAGWVFGGGGFGRGELYAMLSNPIYIGRIRHRSRTYDGQHKAIIDEDLWEGVQTRLAENRAGEGRAPTATDPSLLAGRLYDRSGERMVASHARKGPRRYRYYVSRSLIEGTAEAAQTDGMRLPAPEIEGLVVKAITDCLGDPLGLIERIGTSVAGIQNPNKLIAAAKDLIATISGSDPNATARLIGSIVQRIEIGQDAVAIALDARQLSQRLSIETKAQDLQLTVPAKLKRPGMAMRLVLRNGETSAPRVDDKLVQAIATARNWWQELLDNPRRCIIDLAHSHGLTDSWIARSIRLAFLDPAIVEQILAGKVPADLNLDVLRDGDAIPPLWADQRRMHRVGTAKIAP